MLKLEASIIRRLKVKTVALQQTVWYYFVDYQHCKVGNQKMNVVENTYHRPEIPYFHSGIFIETINTACRWSKLSSKIKLISIDKVVILSLQPNYGVWKTEENGARKGNTKLEAKTSLLVLMLWTAVISLSISVLCTPLVVA